MTSEEAKIIEAEAHASGYAKGLRDGRREADDDDFAALRWWTRLNRHHENIAIGLAVFVASWCVVISAVLMATLIRVAARW